MLHLLSSLLLGVVNLLPDSPFQTLLEGELYKLDFLPYVNWFIPFDNALRITELWLVSMIAYYLYDTVKGIIQDFIIAKLTS
jgi:hypothetical protein